MAPCTMSVPHNQGGTHTTRPRATPTRSSTIRPLRLPRTVVRPLCLRCVQLLPLASLCVEAAQVLSPDVRWHEARGTHRHGSDGVAVGHPPGQRKAWPHADDHTQGVAGGLTQESIPGAMQSQRSFLVCTEADWTREGRGLSQNRAEGEQGE